MTKNSIISLYKTPQGQIKVMIQDENVWMNQTQIGELFGKDRSTIAKHILNIYAEGELKEKNTISLIKANVQNIHISFNKPTKYYNLDLIFAVGYRVRGSEKAIAFRTWTTNILKEYSLRGFVMDDERLGNGGTINGKIDFDLLLQKVREIRFSEKQTYEKIKDLFTTAIDYDSKSKITRKFFAKIQNKFVYAITGHTTAELIVNRVSANKQALGMKSSKKGIVTKKEATTGKNYLLEKELKHLYLLCEQFFSFAELQVSLERKIKMQDWSNYLDDILKMSKLEILPNAGKISNDKMKKIVEKEIIKYQEKWGSLDIYIETIKEVKKINN